MNYEEILTFLEIYRRRGISQAAEAMYVAQSTVSQRLKRLEQDVGGELFDRHPGTKGIGLTSKGQLLLPIARKIEALSYELTNLTERNPRVSLTVGAITSVHDAILPELLLLLSEQTPELQITDLASRQSVDLYNMVQDRTIDVAFVSFDLRSSDVICQLAFQEPYYLIASKGLLSGNGSKNPSTLDPAQELFYSFSGTFQKWHNITMLDGESPHLKTSTFAMYYQLASKIPFWSICPSSWINCLLSMGLQIDVFDLVDPPSPRRTFLIKRRANPFATPAAEPLFDAAMLKLSQMERPYPFLK